MLVSREEDHVCISVQYSDVTTQNVFYEKGIEQKVIEGNDLVILVFSTHSCEKAKEGS